MTLYRVWLRRTDGRRFVLHVRAASRTRAVSVAVRYAQIVLGDLWSREYPLVDRLPA